MLQLTPLEITYILACRNQKKFGYYGEKEFINTYGIAHLFMDYPKLLQLKGGKSGGTTVEDYLKETCGRYLETRFSKIMQTFHLMINPKSKERWQYSGKLARNTVVQALNYLAPQLQAVDPSYTPPDIDLEQVYSVYYSIVGPLQSNNSFHSHCHLELTKRELLAWAETNKITSASQIAYDLCAFFAKKQAGEFMVEKETYSYRIHERDVEQMDTIIQVVLGYAQSQTLLPLHHVEAEEERFQFEINTNCEAEQCSHYIDVDVSRKELLEWGSIRFFDHTASIEFALEEWFKERSNTEEDDHSHNYDYGQEGYLQLETMVTLIKAQQEGKL